jgi:hypothetical protein
MGEEVEKVTLPFDEAGENGPGSAPAIDGALALSPLGTAEANAAATAERLADYAQSWGITISSDFIPATKAQVAYWRELCGAISPRGVGGMQDSDWPTDLTPSKATLQAMAERRLIVRRRRAWHLKRKWHAWLQYLRLTAVPTPALTISERPAPGLPTYTELQVWEALCRWLDGQPQCRARLPMADVPGVGEVSAELLRAMRKAKLVRHRSDCTWALSPSWKAILLALWHGVIKAEGERQSGARNDPIPFSVAAGIDTWYLNRLDPAGLTSELKMQLEDLQEQARHNDEEVETPWRFDGTPLLMYRAGVNTNQGGGVSWSYILRKSGKRYPVFGALGLPCAFTTLGRAVACVLATPLLSAAWAEAQWKEYRADGHVNSRINGRAHAPVRMVASGATGDDTAQDDEPVQSQRHGMDTRSAVIRWVDGEVSPLELLADLTPAAELKRVGQGYLGWCPFHDDRAPDADGAQGTRSFYVVHNIRYGWSWRCLSTNCAHAEGPMRHSFRLFQELLQLDAVSAIGAALLRWPEAGRSDALPRKDDRDADTTDDSAAD